MTAPENRKLPKRLNPLTWVLALSSVFFMVFLIISGGIYLYHSPGQAKEKRSFLSGGGGQVGIIELNGVIMDSKKILKNLEHFADDDEIKAVVLRLNSPGGAVAPSQEIYEAVKAYKKPLVVSMSSVAASGAYYIAMGAKRVYANPGTITGSIGVIMEFVNLQKLYEWAKVQRYSIKTGKFKDAGAEYREMTTEERELLQTMVNDVLLQFKKAVATGRKLSMEKVDAIADGRIFSGAQAKALNLVDELGTLDMAIADAARQAKITGKPHSVYPERRRSSRLLELLMDEGAHDESAAESSVSPVRGVVAQLARAFLGERAEQVTREALPEPGVYWLWKGARW
ncbi:signal peptide peptidase SppA [Bdellovibrionota bacterium FG-1]